MTYIRVRVEETGGKTTSGWYTGIGLEVTEERKKALCYLEPDLAVRTAIRLSQNFHPQVEKITTWVEKKL